MLMFYIALQTQAARIHRGQSLSRQLLPVLLSAVTHTIQINPSGAWSDATG